MVISASGNRPSKEVDAAVIMLAEPRPHPMARASVLKPRDAKSGGMKLKKMEPKIVPTRYIERMPRPSAPLRPNF